MLLHRYILREVTLITIIALIVVIPIFLAFSTMHYIEEVVQGYMPIRLIFFISLFLAPILISFLLPFCLYCGVLLGFNKLYRQSEIIIFKTSGASEWEIFKPIILLALIISLTLLILSMFVNPWLLQKRNDFINVAKSFGAIENIITPKHFQISPDKRYIIYVADISNNIMNNIFIKNREENNFKLFPRAASKETIIVAKSATIKNVEGNNYLEIKDGKQYLGTPGELDYQITTFDEYKLFLSSGSIKRGNENTFSFNELIEKSFAKDKSAQAEIQYRIAAPLMSLILPILGFALNKIGGSRGQRASFLPAILLYILYANLIIITSNFIEQGKISPYFGTFGIHIFFLLLSLGINIFAKNR